MAARSFFVFVCVFVLVACGDDTSGGNDQNDNGNSNSTTCGDGILDIGEQCDDGSSNSDSMPDACRTDCRFAYCGDSVIDQGEVCDSDDLDQATCQSESFTKGEISCDDQCELDLSGCSTCGDDTAEGSDTTQTMYESCDGADLRGQDCVSVGQAAGILACNTDCTWDFDLCLGGAVCLDDSECAGGQQICDNNVCRSCTMGECGTGRVCSGGFCLAGDCYIDAQVWNEGDSDPNNVCHVCNRATTQTSWSPNGGQSCDDTNDCSYGDTCNISVPGVCVGVAYTCPSEACSMGVCHGTGPTDCTQEIQSSFNGCFIDGSCYNNNDEKPGNPCQRCDAANNVWAELAAGTSCGSCKICGVSGSEMDCLLVNAGEDPHNDCTDVCSVCNSTGGCQWTAAATDPNDNCQASAISTCGLTGDCFGGTNQCAYHTGGLGQVNDGNPCTTNDVCDGAGSATGTPLADLTKCNTTKICMGGICSNCTNSSQCAGGEVCITSTGDCTSGNCTVGTDCTSDPGVCHYNACISNNCVPQPLNTGSCVPDPVDNCVTSATCSSGTCVPTAYVDCTSHGYSCTTSSCQTSGSCAIDYVNSGSCLIASLCYTSGDDNPSNECRECVSTTSQTAWSNKVDNTICRASVACQDLCRSGSCLNRFYVGNCLVGVLGVPCLVDRKYDRAYYEIGTSGCPRGTYGYTDGVSACQALGTGWELATTSALHALDDGGTSCTTTSCDGLSLAVDPAADLLDIARDHKYWGRDFMGINHYSVSFDASGAHTVGETVWHTKSYSVICVEYF